jgi:hypothetical protein
VIRGLQMSAAELAGNVLFSLHPLLSLPRCGFLKERVGSNSMPWRCPACQSAIHHSELEDRPQTGHVYRCHVCRLDLALDSETQRLAVAPFRDDHDPRAKAIK